jgi:hypothetical protein
MKFNVQFDIARARREVKATQKQINAGAARALQRVAVSVRKASDQKMRETLALPSKAVKNALDIKAPAGQKTLVREVVATGFPIPIRDYSARRTQRKGVTFKVLKGGPRKAWQVKGRKGFIIDRLGGHVFARSGEDPPGPAKAPIKKAYGPSITQRFRTKQVQGVMDATARARWPIEFEREMKFRAGK